MSDRKFTFSDEEVEVLRFLSERFHRGGSRFSVSSVPIPDGCDEQWRWRIVGRLANYGYIESETIDSYRIYSGIASLVDRIDNPPPQNHWKELLTWWFASRWRAAVTAFLVILPLIVQWIAMIKTVLEWIGVT